LQGGPQDEEEPGIAIMGAEDSMVYKAALESQIERFLRSQRSRNDGDESR
jgi:hypothetical protein